MSVSLRWSRRLQRGSPATRSSGLALAATLALLAATLIPRLPADLGTQLVAPGWLPHQLVQLLEYSNDIQVAMLARRPPGPHPRIVLVLITDDTLASLPYISPIDRGLLARLVKAVDDLGARTIGLDILFDQATEPEKDAQLLERLKLTRASLVLGAADERTPLPARRRVWQKLFLDRSGQPTGFLNLRYDVREAAQTHVVRNRAAAARSSAYALSFAEALARASGVTAFPASRRIAWLRAPGGGGDVFTTIDADAVLSGAQAPDGPLALALQRQIEGRIVLIGADVEGKDRHPTPLSLVEARDMQGVAVHAQILAGLVDQRALSDIAPAGAALMAGAAAFLGALVGWFAARRRLVLTLLVSCGTLAVIGVSGLVLWQQGVVVPLAATVAVLAGAAMVTRFARNWLVR